MKKFLTRTLSGAIYVMLMVGAIYAGVPFASEAHFEPNAAGIYIFGIVFFVIGLIGIYEYTHNLAKTGTNCNRPMAFIVGIATYIILFASNSSLEFKFIWIAQWKEVTPLGVPLSLTLLYTALPAMILSIFLVQLWHHDADPFTTIGHTLMPTIWIMTPLALTNYIHSASAGLMMMVFVLIWVNDSFAYMTGMLLGKHKMWERHSPGKTWEGTIGGMLFCIAAAVLIGPLFGSCATQIDRADWIVIGLLCSVLGTLGDLVESMFKRHCGVKDSGNIMPGHGGILDRFDSLLLAVPFVQAYLIITLS